MGCFLDDLRAFGINDDQWTTAAQGVGGWRKTAEQGAKRLVVKWIAAEKVRAGLIQHAVNALTKRVPVGSLAIVD